MKVIPGFGFGEGSLPLEQKCLWRALYDASIEITQSCTFFVSYRGRTCPYKQKIIVYWNKSRRNELTKWAVSLTVFNAKFFSLYFEGYMDGAVDAGERAAREILHVMKKISKDEIYQEEPASEDIPPVPCCLTPQQSCLPSVPTFMTMLTVLSLASMFGIAYLKHS